MKVGIEFQIDVTKIEKARIFQGAKGKYLTMTAFVETDMTMKDQYGNSGMITHKKNEGEERAPILGNSKVFWSSEEQAPQNNVQQIQQAPQEDFGDIPF